MSRAESQLRRRRRKERKQRVSRSRYHGLPREFENGLSGPRSPRIVRLHSYTITEEALKDDRDESGDSAARKFLYESCEDLFHQVHEDPAGAIPQLEKLLERFPECGTLMNWLATAYGHTHQQEKAEQISERNFQLHPDYLFARVNRAALLLEQSKTDEAAEVMENKWDLKQLYPSRDVFHMSEFLALSHVAVMYHTQIGQLEMACSITESMEEIDPDHSTTEAARAMVARASLATLFEKAQHKIRRLMKPRFGGGSA
jgi:tetratricopeptide (TPR) repeat protein